MKNQGKTTQQYKDSETFAFIGYLGVALVALLSIMSCVESEQQKQDKWDQGQCGEPLTKQDSLELVEPDAIYYDTMLDIDMDCGGGEEN